jgi:hypothetical protein
LRTITSERVCCSHPSDRSPRTALQNGALSLASAHTRASGACASYLEAAPTTDPANISQASLFMARIVTPAYRSRAVRNCAAEMSGTTMVSLVTAQSPPASSRVAQRLLPLVSQAHRCRRWDSPTRRQRFDLQISFHNE